MPEPASESKIESQNPRTKSSHTILTIKTSSSEHFKYMYHAMQYMYMYMYNRNNAYLTITKQNATAGKQTLGSLNNNDYEEIKF